MSETNQLGLTLVEAAQAQKHITVNEALVRLDAAAALTVVDWDLALPPSTPVDGAAYLVGSSAIAEWTGKDQHVAIWSNGGWVYLAPKTGWEAWNLAIGAPVTFDGVSWGANVAEFSASGAATLNRVIEADHVISAGANSVTLDIIPSHAQVVGVTARVIADITGSGVASWSLGVAGDETRYATGLGLTLNSYANGISGSPQTYWANTPLVLTPDAGTFTDGTVTIAVHVTELVPPRAV